MSQTQSKPDTPVSQTTHSDRSERDPRVGCFLFFLLLAILCGVNSAWTIKLDQTSCSTIWTQHQQIFDDNLVNSLKNESKFELNFSDDTWLMESKYINWNLPNTTGINWVYGYDAEGVSGSHYPAMPYILRFGLIRDSLFVSILSGLLLIGLGLLIWTIHKHFGWPAAIICACLIMADAGLHMSPMSNVGDGAIAALIVLSFVAVIQNQNADKQAIWKYPIAGVLLGATTIFQFQQSLWLIVFLIGWLGYVVAKLIWQRKSLGPFLEGSALFMVGLIIVAAPWWVRNCKVTGELKPLGYAIESNLVGAYSDAAILLKGDLNTDQILKFRESLAPQFENPDLSLIEKEKIIADANSEAAAQWREANPTLNSTLMLNRVKNHLGFGSRGYTIDPAWIVLANATCAAIGILGCFLCWHRMGNIVFFVCLASVVVTALTWSDGGRLFIPVRPLLYATFAVGIARTVGLLRKTPKGVQRVSE